MNGVLPQNPFRYLRVPYRVKAMAAQMDIFGATNYKTCQTNIDIQIQLPYISNAARYILRIEPEKESSLGVANGQK